MTALPDRPTTPAPRSKPYLHQAVIFWDAHAPRIDGVQIPRAAVVSGFCEDPTLVHLTVFNHPDEDCRLQGIGPVRALCRIPFRDSVSDKSMGLHTYCVPAVSAPSPWPEQGGSLRIPVVGTIRRDEEPASSAEDVTLPADMERKLVPLGDNGQPIEDQINGFYAKEMAHHSTKRRAKRNPPEQPKRLRKSK